jgi:hypothetical protein
VRAKSGRLKSTFYTRHSLTHRQSMERRKNKTPTKSDLMPGTLELLILKTLERHRDPMHGYGIARHIQGVSHEVLRVEEGSLYPALQRLSVKGWVKAEWGLSDITGAPVSTG